MLKRDKVIENAANQSLYIKDWIFRNILLLSCVRASLCFV